LWPDAALTEPAAPGEEDDAAPGWAHQIPVLPFDEIALAIALTWLAIFHLPPCAPHSRPQPARPPEKEHGNA
jgi:hypothetical protein